MLVETVDQCLFRGNLIDTILFRCIDTHVPCLLSLVAPLLGARRREAPCCASTSHQLPARPEGDLAENSSKWVGQGRRRARTQGKTRFDRRAAGSSRGHRRPLAAAMVALHKGDNRRSRQVQRVFASVTTAL